MTPQLHDLKVRKLMLENDRKWKCFIISPDANLSVGQLADRILLYFFMLLWFLLCNNIFIWFDTHRVYKVSQILRNFLCRVVLLFSSFLLLCLPHLLEILTRSLESILSVFPQYIITQCTPTHLTSNNLLSFYHHN